MLTLQQVGALGIKLLGVTFLARTVLAGFSLLAVRFAPPGAGPEGEFFAAQAVSALGYPVVAWLYSVRPTTWPLGCSLRYLSQPASALAICL